MIGMPSISRRLPSFAARGLPIHALVIAVLCAAPLRAERRVALLVGENAGDAMDAPLAFAESDAAAMAQVLTELGGVPSEEVRLLRGARAPELRDALASLEREPLGKEDRLILYISAHAGAGELHLRGTRFPIAELRRFLDRSPAGVALLILDTCEAGAALRAKGVKAIAARVVQVERPSLTGKIVIASAGPDQSAFESQELGGSLFTQHFIAGLRGAADLSRDGRVTLEEAYRYAYARTLDSAAALSATPQTPEFDMDLRGAGELVLAETHRGRARLTLAIEAPGEWTVAPLDGSAEVLRFVKSAGPAELALEPGTFRLRARSGDGFAEETLQLQDGGAQIVTDADLARWPQAPAGRKGSGAIDRLEALSAISSAAVSGVGPLGGGGIAWLHRFDGSLPVRGIVTAELSLVAGAPPDNAFLERELALVAGGGVEGSVGPILLRAVGEAGAVGVHQGGRPSGNVTAAEPRADLSLGASWSFAWPWSLELSALTGATLTRTDTRHLQPLVAARGGVGFTW